MPTIKKLYIYEESHLPDDGWLQGCCRCGTISSNIFFFYAFNRNLYSYECYGYVCKLCLRKVKNDTLTYIDFTRDCIQTLKNNYPNYFPVEPKPPSPLDVVSKLSTNSTLKS